LVDSDTVGTVFRDQLSKFIGEIVESFDPASSAVADRGKIQAIRTMVEVTECMAFGTDITVRPGIVIVAFDVDDAAILSRDDDGAGCTATATYGLHLHHPSMSNVNPSENGCLSANSLLPYSD
jgi:hypothetical protein